MTVLVPVRDWAWCLYKVRYWRDEAHSTSGEEPLLEREFIESDAHADSWVYGSEDGQPEGGWPYSPHARPDWATYDLVQENVGDRLCFVSGGRMGGTRVLGAGWRTELPPGWYGRGVGE